MNSDYKPDVPNPYASPRGGDEVIAPRETYPPGSVPNYLVPSILCMLFCCWPMAIPAIVYASQVNTKLSQGDYHGAVMSSQNAKKWCWISATGGLIVMVLYATMLVLVEAN